MRGFDNLFSQFMLLFLQARIAASTSDSKDDTNFEFKLLLTFVVLLHSNTAIWLLSNTIILLLTGWGGEWGSWLPQSGRTCSWGRGCAGASPPCPSAWAGACPSVPPSCCSGSCPATVGAGQGRERSWLGAGKCPDYNWQFRTHPNLALRKYFLVCLSGVMDTANYRLWQGQE